MREQKQIKEKWRGKKSEIAFLIRFLYLFLKKIGTPQKDQEAS